MRLLGQGNPFHEAPNTVLVLMLLPEVWNSVVSDATEDRRFIGAGPIQHLAALLCDLVLCG